MLIQLCLPAPFKQFSILTFYRYGNHSIAAQQYMIIQTEKDFEIRFYPYVNMATITSAGKSTKELDNSGFNKLAGFISGENESKQQIETTSPLHRHINDEVSAMSFVMPSQYNKNNVPKPLKREALLATHWMNMCRLFNLAALQPIRKLCSIQKITEPVLKENSLNRYGNFRFLVYNSPYQLFCRKKEVIVSLNWKPNQGRSHY